MELSKGFDFSSKVEMLSTRIDEYKVQTFKASLKVMGIFQSETEKIMDKRNETMIDVFEYTGKERKKTIICLNGFCPLNGFDKRKNVIESPLEFDKVMNYLTNQSRISDGCEIILDGNNNGKKNEKHVQCYFGKNMKQI